MSTFPNFQDALSFLSLDESNEALSQAFIAEKHRLLVALRKDKPNDELLSNDYCLKYCRYDDSALWDDSLLNTLSGIEEQQFDINVYLLSAKWVMLRHLGLEKIHNKCGAHAYILCHARRYGDPSRRVYEFTNEPKPPPEIPYDVTTTDVEVMCEFAINMFQLIDQLQSDYNEDKYIVLNLNITYLVLLTILRVVKSDEYMKVMFRMPWLHAGYNDMCPKRLCSKISQWATNVKIDKSNLKSCLHLAVYASLYCEDQKTLNVMFITCLSKLRGLELGLPTLFNKVAHLYHITDGELWDLLSTKILSTSLFKLSNFRYKQYCGSKEHRKKYKSFPYCRVIDPTYHRNLSASSNDVICRTLAILVDMKRGLGKSYVRNFYSEKQDPNLPTSGRILAKEIYDKLVQKKAE